MAKILRRHQDTIKPEEPGEDLDALNDASGAQYQYDSSRSNAPRPGKEHVYHDQQPSHSQSHDAHTSNHGSSCHENVPSSSNSNSVAPISNSGGSQPALVNPQPAGRQRKHKKQNTLPSSKASKHKKRSFRINIEDLMLKDSALQQSKARWHLERLKYKRQHQNDSLLQIASRQSQMLGLPPASKLDLSSSSGALVKIQEQFDMTSSEEGYSFR